MDDRSQIANFDSVLATAKELMDRLGQHHPESALDSIEGAFYALATKLLQGSDDMGSIRNPLGMVFQDIGKLFVSAETLNQSIPLASKQREEINSHVPKGFDLLKEYNNNFLTELVGPAILEHHMNWNRGLGQQTVYGSIIRIFDVLGAMTSPYRYYGHRKSIGEAINEIYNSGEEKYNLSIVNQLRAQSSKLIDSCPSSLIAPQLESFHM